MCACVRACVRVVDSTVYLELRPDMVTPGKTFTKINGAFHEFVSSDETGSGFSELLTWVESDDCC